MKGTFRYRTAALPLALLLILLLTAGVMSPLLAQNSDIILTVLTPEWMGDLFTEEFFDGFEAQNPGVKVIPVVSRVDNFYYTASDDLDGYLDTAAEYAAQADVMQINTWSLGVEATRAGNFLDLRPLVDGDLDFMPEDFLPGALDNFRWDNGLWAIPVSVSAQLVVYDAAAFDAAGLAYPNEQWRLADFAAAARALTQVDAEGKVQRPGMVAWNVGLMYRALTGQNLMDETSIPPAPNLTDPALEAFLAEWLALEEEGILNNFDTDYDYNTVPLRIEQTYALSGIVPAVGEGESVGEQRLQAALLGGGAGLISDAFAVSAGTLYPELSFALVKYLTSSPQVVQRFFADSPARRSMIDAPQEPGGSGLVFVGPELPEETQQMIDLALESGIPYSEMLYSEYVSEALASTQREENPVSLRAALQTAQAEVLANLETARQRSEASAVVVATAVPTPSFGADEIVLEFGLNIYVSPLPNRELWEQAVAEFAATDPEVGHVVLNSGFGSIDDMQMNDCSYVPENIVQTADLSTLLSLDPFLNADPAFDPNDMLPSVLSRVQRDGRTYAYPIAIQPLVLWYLPEAFAQAGLPEPEAGWTVDAFITALEALKQNLVDPKADVLDTNSLFGNSLWLMLSAIYGGVPVDYTTTPATLNLTDPATVEAVRQALDLARADLIEYAELDTDNLFFISGAGGGGGGGTGPAMQAEYLSSYNFRLENLENPEFSEPYHLTTFPRGNTGTPVSFELGTAYIRADTPAAEACYRWISFIASRPALFNAMPARRSLLTDAEFTASQPSMALDFYAAYAELLNDPNLVSVATPSLAFGGTSGAWLEVVWINQALDAYVLEGKPLEDGLLRAEQNITAFRECTAGIEPFDPTSTTDGELVQAYFQQFNDCATAVDASLAPRFAPPQ